MCSPWRCKILVGHWIIKLNTMELWHQLCTILFLFILLFYTLGKEMLYYIDLPGLVCQSKYIVPINNLLVVLNPLQTAKTTKECSCNVMNYNYLHILWSMYRSNTKSMFYRSAKCQNIIFIWWRNIARLENWRTTWGPLHYTQSIHYTILDC